MNQGTEFLLKELEMLREMQIEDRLDAVAKMRTISSIINGLTAGIILSWFNDADYMSLFSDEETKALFQDLQALGTQTVSMLLKYGQKRIAEKLDKLAYVE